MQCVCGKLLKQVHGGVVTIRFHFFSKHGRSLKIWKDLRGMDLENWIKSVREREPSTPAVKTRGAKAPPPGQLRLTNIFREWPEHKILTESFARNIANPAMGPMQCPPEWLRFFVDYSKATGTRQIWGGPAPSSSREVPVKDTTDM